MLKKISTYLLCLIAMLTLAGCRADLPDPGPDVPGAGGEAAGYLRIAVSTAGISGTRANPTGGENGDGYEHGRGNENIIHNLSVFLYVDEGEGLDGDYRFVWKKYVDSQTLEDSNPDHPYDHIYNVSIPLFESDINTLGGVSGKMRLAVVANAGNRTPVYGSTTQLVKDLTYPSAWQGENPAEADYFVMSPAYNGAKSGNNDGGVTRTVTTEGTVYSGTVNLERVAARIDLLVSTQNIVSEDNEQSLRYYAGGTANYLTLTNAIPVNLMGNNSYLVKQVADRYEDTWMVAGDELMDSEGRPTNYVITPNFGDKPSADWPKYWYGASYAPNLRALSAGELALRSPLSERVASAFRPEGAGATERSIVLTYANENTHPAELQIPNESGREYANPSDYLTGLLLRAQYHPAVLYTKGDLSETKEYVDGEDFYLFRTVAESVKESKNLYFSSNEALDEYMATLPAGGKYETAAYPGGICYYNVWIKHANTEADPEENFPMKYGIVRNNIYRISLNFEGIGEPTPEIREPNAVTTRIFVIKWNFRPQPEIIM